MKASLFAVPSTLAELRTAAAALATDFKALGDKPVPRHLRKQLVELRAALFQLGVYDPVLGRLDSATVPQAAVNEITEQLSRIASSL